MTRFFKLKENDINILFHIHRKGYITKKESDYGGYKYYFSIWRLRDLGLINMGGVENGNQKMWTLSDMGKEVCKCFIKIKNLMEGNYESEQRDESKSDNISQ
jgi:hypothetical protein